MNDLEKSCELKRVQEDLLGEWDFNTNRDNTDCVGVSTGQFREIVEKAFNAGVLCGEDELKKIRLELAKVEGLLDAFNTMEIWRRGRIKGISGWAEPNVKPDSSVVVFHPENLPPANTPPASLSAAETAFTKEQWRRKYIKNSGGLGSKKPFGK